MKGKEEIPYIFYLYIHSKLKEHLNGNISPEKEVRSFLFQWKIPTNLRPLIIKELELLGLIKRENKFLIKFNDSDFNQENVVKYYQQLGLWEK